jgi:hypothetical protein
MYVNETQPILAGSLRNLGRAGRAVAMIAGAVLIGFGIPAVWVWVAGTIQSSSGDQGLAFAAVLTAFAGIVGSYIGLIAALGMLSGWRMSRRGETLPVRRHNWNRSMRDERHTAPALSPLETLFVTTALLVGCAYMVWFLAFAGSSLPAGA